VRGSVHLSAKFRQRLLIAAVNGAQGLLDQFSDLSERQLAPDPRNDNFTFQVRKFGQKRLQVGGLVQPIIGWQEPRHALFSGQSLVPGTPPLGSSLIHRSTTGSQVQPCDRVIRLRILPHQIDECLLHGVFRCTTPLPRIQRQCRAMQIDQLLKPLCFNMRHVLVCQITVRSTSAPCYLLQSRREFLAPDITHTSPLTDYFPKENDVIEGKRRYRDGISTNLERRN
jgi:hypothetical protein